MSTANTVAPHFQAPPVNNQPAIPAETPMSPAQGPITLTFHVEKETKNTFKFEEDERQGRPKIVGSLYAQKFVAKGKTKATVTIVFE
jgi:hypothetical protein